MLSKIIAKTRILPLALKALTRSFDPLFPTKPATFRFSTKKLTPEQLEELKRQGQQFYSTQLSDIIELKSVEEFNTIASTIQLPILINFYADWNLACKTMTPRLEEKAKQANGAMKVININIDKFGQIANSFQVKAVPTVFLAYKGKLIDSFSGQISNEMLGVFLQSINRLTKISQADEDAVKVLGEVQNVIKSGDYPKAEQLLTEMKTLNIKEEFILVKNIFLAHVYAQLAKVSHLKSLLQVMTKHEQFYLDKPQFKDLYLDLVEMCKENEKAQEDNDQFLSWKKKLSEDPSNLALKYQAALFYQQNQLLEEALNQLLSIVKTNKQWQQKKANKLMLEIFKKLGNASPLTQSFRKQLQRAMH